MRAFCATLGARVRELGATLEGCRMALGRCLKVVVAYPGGRLDIQTAIPLTPVPAQATPPPAVVRYTLVLPAGSGRGDAR